MEAQMYKQLSEIEDRHWWHQSRMQIAAHYIRHMDLPEPASIVDVGCGTGGTTRHLERFGRVKGIDRCDDALQHARNKVRQAELLCADATRLDELLPAHSIDLVTFFGVLYHKWIGDDLDMLRRVQAVLKPDGYVLLAEPAHKILWRRHDVLDMGKTRYSLGDFRQLFQKAGLRYCQGRYFNALAYPICLAMALRQRLSRTSNHKNGDLAELSLPPAAVNRALMHYMTMERALTNWVPYPLGVSLMVVGRKPSTI